MRSINAWTALLAVTATLLVAIGRRGIVRAQMRCPAFGECPDGTGCVRTDNGAICVECSTGTASIEGSCTTCESPSYQDEAGQSACKSRTCGEGRRFNYIDAETRPTCPQCEAGKYQFKSDHTISTCRSCIPVENFQDQPGQANCKATLTCTPGQHVTMYATLTTDRECGSCEPGTFSSTLNEPDCNPFQDCGAGTFVLSEPTITADRVCMDCAQGHFSTTTNAGVCTTCSPGTYQDKTGQAGCKPCDNSYQPSGGGSGCIDWSTCGPGQKWIAGGDRSDAICGPCQSGTYQDAAEHQEKCKAWSVCGEGYRVTQQPSDTQDRICAPCDKGKYQDKTNRNTCKLCEAGTHQPSSGQGSCLPCQTGTFQPVEGQAGCTKYSTCGQGEFFKVGTKTLDRTCEDCPIGKFQGSSAHRATACHTCNAGKHQLNSGQSSCMACDTCAAGLTEQVACKPTSNRDCADVTDPVIILIPPDDQGTRISEADNIYTVEAGLEFVPPVAVVTDSAMQGVTLVKPTDMEINAIDTSAESSDQTLTYTATDAAGNKASRTITIVVDDTTGPDITFSPATLFLEAGDPISRSNYTRGVTILDKVDGMLNINLLVIDSSNVKVNKLGEYTITYTLSEPDSAGNEAPPTIQTVVVHDTLNPVLTVVFSNHEIMQDNLVVHEAATDLTIPTGSVTDTFDQTIRNSDIQFTETPEFTSITNDSTRFQLTYSVSDASGNTATETYTVEIRDTIAPVITITGDASVDHEAGTVYTDMGFTATDALEHAMGRDIQTSTLNDVNSNPPSVPANFTVEYEACDAAGNCATDTRQVRVDDTTPPAITLNGNARLVVEAGQTFSDIDPGVTLSDLYYDSTDLTLTIDEGGYTGKPATTSATFTVTYVVEDPSANKASIERTVVVVDTTPPNLRLNGEAEVVVGDGREWQEPGVARAQDTLDGDLLQNVTVTIELMDVGAVERQQCEASSAQAFVPPLTPRVWSAPASDIVTSDAPGGTVYGIRYAVTDAAGNEAVRERMVRVEDSSTPSLALLGAEVQTLEYTTSEDGAFVESDGGAASTDAHDGDLSGSICVGVVADMTAASGVLSPSNVDTTARAAIANVQQRLRTMTTNASESSAVNNSSSNNDSNGSNSTIKLNTLGTAVASAEVGTVYVVQYTVHDRAGRTPSPLYRAVVVVDTTPPQLTLSGEAEVRVPYATRYDEAGYTAVDTHDGNVTAAVVVGGADAIDVHVAGTYNVTYTVVDANGNEAVETRAVVVEARPRPETLEGHVVELVLAGTPEELFNSDEQELEMLLEETLGVDFVVVFLFYNKRDGRPSTTARRALDARDDIAHTFSSSSSSSSSSAMASSPSSSSSASRRHRRTGRGLLAKDQTVVEFGARNATDLEWMSADGIVARLKEIKRDPSSSATLPISSARSTDASASNDFPFAIIVGAAAGGVVLILLVVLLLWRRAHGPKSAPASISDDCHGFQHANPMFQPSTYDIVDQRSNGASLHSPDRLQNQYQAPIRTKDAPMSDDLYGTPRNIPVTANDTAVAVREEQRRKTLWLSPSAATGLPGSVAGSSEFDTYDVPRSKPRIPEKPQSMRGVALSTPGEQGAAANGGDGGGDGELYDMPRNKPRVPQKPQSMRGVPLAPGSEHGSSLKQSNVATPQEGGNMYDVPRSAPRVLEKPATMRGVLSAGQGQHDALSAPNSGGGDEDEMYELPRVTPYVPARAQQQGDAGAAKGGGGSGSRDEETYDLPRLAPRAKPRASVSHDNPKAAAAAAGGREDSSMPQGVSAAASRAASTQQLDNPQQYSQLPMVKPSTATHQPQQQQHQMSRRESSKTLRRDPRGSRVLNIMGSEVNESGDSGDNTINRMQDASMRRPTVRGGAAAAGDGDPMRMQARQLGGYIGEANRMQAEQRLSGHAQGAYLWRVSANRPGAVLSMVSTKRMAHHVFSQDASSGLILMNGKPLSQPCYDLSEAVVLLKRKTEQTSCVLMGPVPVEGPRKVVAASNAWLMPALDRAAVKSLLHHTPDGTFLVTASDNDFALFLSYNYDVASHKMSYGSHGWVVRQQLVPATTLEECIAALHSDPHGLPCVLTGPPGQDAMA